MAVKEFVFLLEAVGGELELTLDPDFFCDR